MLSSPTVEQVLTEEVNDTGKDKDYDDTEHDDQKTSAADTAADPPLYPSCHGFSFRKYPPCRSMDAY